jgi:hypothetical protein
MGVEYVHYLIPEDNTYKPSPADLNRLVDALIDGGIVLRTGTDTFKREIISTIGDSDHGCYVHLGEGEYYSFLCPCSAQVFAAFGERVYRIVWRVDSSNESGLRCPLSPFPDWGDAYYELQLHVANDFVYHTSKLIKPFNRLTCDCGQSWEPDDEFDLWPDGPPPFWDSRIPRSFPSCGSPFRPQEHGAHIRDGRKGKAVDRPGGATYRFAVVIDCGKGLDRQSWPIRAADEFLAVVTTTLGQPFYQVDDY